MHDCSKAQPLHCQQQSSSLSQTSEVSSSSSSLLMAINPRELKIRLNQGHSMVVGSAFLQTPSAPHWGLLWADTRALKLVYDDGDGDEGVLTRCEGDILWKHSDLKVSELQRSNLFPRWSRRVLILSRSRGVERALMRFSDLCLTPVGSHAVWWFTDSLNRCFMS